MPLQSYQMEEISNIPSSFSIRTQAGATLGVQQQQQPPFVRWSEKRGGRIMPQTLLFLKPLSSAPSNSTLGWSKPEICGYLVDVKTKIQRRGGAVCLGMLAPRKFMQKRKKIEVFKDAAHEADQKNWRKLMTEIDEAGSAVSVLRSRRTRNEPIPKDLILGTLVRFKQLKKWNLVSEILEWLQTQHWWDFNEMDYLMLITAYGKLGDFNKVERVLSYMTKKGYPPTVISHTALMEAYGRGGEYNKAEAMFRRMQSSGPEPSALTYQIILKIFVEVLLFFPSFPLHCLEGCR